MGAGTEYFAVLGAAQRLGKATLIVNAVFEAHTGWLPVLSRLDDFCVRDQHSLDHARSHGLRCRLVPDSFLGAVFDQPAFVDLSDRIVVTDWHPARDADVGQTLRTLLDRVESTFYFPMLHGVQSHLWRGAAAAWASSSLVITARHHGIYLAAAARKPFVALPSNTLKVQGLLAAAGVHIPVCVSPAEVEAALAFALDHLDRYERLFDWLEAQRPLSTFSVLGRASCGSTADAELARLTVQRAPHDFGHGPQFWGLGNGTAGRLVSLG